MNKRTRMILKEEGGLLLGQRRYVPEVFMFQNISGKTFSEPVDLFSNIVKEGITVPAAEILDSRVSHPRNQEVSHRPSRAN